MIPNDLLEIKKVLNFILENKKEVLSYKSLFNRKTILTLKKISKSKLPLYSFVLTKEQKDALINIFLLGKGIFNEETPNFICKDERCINMSIERDINSVNYVNYFTPKINEKILELAKSQKIILTSASPSVLKENYEVALNSIRQDVNSANYVFYNNMSNKQCDDLINEIIKLGYELSKDSPFTLSSNPDIAFNSIKRNINTAMYLNGHSMDDQRVLKYLISKNYPLEWKELKYNSIATYSDYDLIKYAIKNSNMFDEFIEEYEEEFNSFSFDSSTAVNIYIERIIKLLFKSITTLPTIEQFKEVAQYYAEREWEFYRKNNINDFANIFAKICRELQTNRIFDSAINNLDILNEIKKALGEKYNVLIQAMKEYHKIINSNEGLDNIDSARDTIAKLSALYVAIRKEEVKKDIIENFYQKIIVFFIPKKDNPLVQKKIIESNQKQRLRELFSDKDKDIISFIESIVNKYKNVLSEKTIRIMIVNFISDNSKLDSFYESPKGFNNYKRYKEACKLINRLNSKYIKYTDSEVTRYLDIIKYNTKLNKYYYCGVSFDEESVNKYNDYIKKKQIFEKIKKDIMFKVKEMKIDKDISYEELVDLCDELPFNDKYFEFDKLYLTKISLDELIFTYFSNCEEDYIHPFNVINDEEYNTLTNFIINNGIIWLLLENIIDNLTGANEVLNIFNYIWDILELSKSFNYDVNKFEDIMALSELALCADEKSIAILGKDIISQLYRYQDYTDEDAEKIINMALDLVCQMATREKSTVPYINGKNGNYLYSMYDSQDEEILLSGIKTDACFRIDGNDNDFLHYCALDKNGFVIKITDTYGNFIGRASGFRNGNGVYINQLRTIYDICGNTYSGEYENERKEIIETFKKACDDIILTSWSNDEEEDKIDFVLVTKSYALQNVKSNVNSEVEEKINDHPMECNSADWKNFVKNTYYLEECDGENVFSTDYGEYPLICISSTKSANEIKPSDIKSKNVKALYTRKRNDILVTQYVDEKILNKLFTEIAPRMKERNGGYTRVLKLGYRQGDAADVVILELVDYKLESEAEEKKPAKKAEGSAPKAKTTKAKADGETKAKKPAAKKTTEKKDEAKSE